MTIAILDYGSGNLHSVSRALARVGGDPSVTGDPAEVGRADALVIPGVGHFGACVRAICHHGLDEAILAFRATGRPVFGVCVGMQVLFEGSDEDPEEGLGVLTGRVRRLPDDVKVPHMGWNTVTWTRPHPYTDDLPDGTRFYFVHSFAPDPGDDAVGVTEHGRPFAAAVAHENVFATQFHPEKSGEAGLQLYERFVKAVAQP
ncbi:MAG: imidazole glycerol phosphate synthase subunit HisH [Actinomycetota bacterium]